MRGLEHGSRRAGFSLLELVLALTIFQVGLLGVAGMVLTAQRALTRAELILRGTLAAKEAGDSLLALGEESAGEIDLPWGHVSWTPTGEGGLRVAATGGKGPDTLAVLRIWPPLPGIPSPRDSVGSGGGHP